MSSFSNYLENAVMNHVLGGSAYTPVATIYVGFSAADPLDDGTGISEPTGNGYTRMAITFSAAASRAVVQSGVIQFPTATGDYALPLTHYVLWDAASGGNILASQALTTSKTIVTGKAPRIPSASISVSINSGAWSNYLANAILDFVFRNQSFSQPSIYSALVETTEVTDSATGATINEIDMTGYGRVAVSAWDTVSGGASANTNDIDHGQFTAGGTETVVAACLVDSGTIGAGNVLMYDNSTNMAIDDNDTFKILAGSWSVSLS